jgi:hypothetical protein
MSDTPLRCKTGAPAGTASSNTVITTEQWEFKMNWLRATVKAFARNAWLALLNFVDFV